MISWINERLAIADFVDVLHHTYDTDTVLVDARAYFGYCNRINRKGSANIYDAVSLIVRNILETQKKVIVFCDAGMDRSPFIVALALCELCDDYTIEDAYKLIKEKRNYIIEHWEWLK